MELSIEEKIAKMRKRRTMRTEEEMGRIKRFKARRRKKQETWKKKN